MLYTGLITFHFAHHYGAQLQAYATMRVLQQLGTSCEIIDYRLPHTTRTNRLFKASGSARDLVSNLHTALHYPAFRRRYRRFEAFVRDHMTLSPQRYESFDALEAGCPPYDVYVAGSDQIWNPFIFQDKQFDKAFLLDFTQQGRRIAYAPSLGVPELPDPLAEELKTFLSPFSALSVREKRGQVLLRQAVGREARVVLDPTLLLTGAQWGDLAAPPKQTTPYILCYFVSEPGEVVPYAQALAAQTGYPIVQLAGARRKIPGADTVIFDAGPREFLGLLQHAAYVCTNSFHGAVFSLQFQKPFFTSISPKERAEPTFSRTYSLLERLGCVDRIIGLDTTAAVDAPMDYQAVNTRLEEARADSMAYLKAALEGTPLPEEILAEQPPARPMLCEIRLCTGCNACASVCPVGAITMKADHEGFLRPAIGSSCILCHKCESVCPGLHPPQIAPSPSVVHAAWNQEEEVRGKSTSGGIFSLLADHTLNQGGAVFGTVLDQDGAVRHICARSQEGVAAMRGAKYVQSDLTGCFQAGKELLDAGTEVLFSGTPCQVDGFKRFLGRDDPHLLTCDLVCHGVPSPAVFRSYLDRLAEDHGAPVVNLAFRDKSHGWQDPWLTADFANGQWYEAPLHTTTYGRGFGMRIFLRPCCTRCQYTNPGRRPADLTLADFWGLDPNLTLPTDRGQGISMVLINTPKGQAVFDTLSPGQVERPLEEAIKGNPRLISPTEPNPKRAVFFAAFQALPFRQVEQQFLSQPSLPYRMAAKVLTPGLKDKIRRFLR